MTTPDRDDKPAWMDPAFRYAPSSPEAIAARERCVPGPDWVPNLQAENRALREEVARLRASPAPDDGDLGASLRDTHREADGAVLAYKEPG